ncbi:ATP-binding cassette domain-containing protein [Paenalcaligenes niemegkensis]|uniref:ABC transporter ATP-binding protein n=1 Tax=Paenalcaligenes niemegkensis TaxID=2895469 RepID=UPI001EE90F8C|nr:oligopeptide/dipeptide ABC transporter ATP-binding protein [Paenalcaligenes niemegkensis]MCQ9615604.1 ATP-binding cassette domain-containing protein [Paenalcaligenes niemegkensis]
MYQDTEVLLEVEGLSKEFVLQRDVLGRTEKSLKAVDNVSFSLHKKEVLGLVGESGSGKTTVGRTLLKLVEPTQGSIHFEGRDISKLSRRAMRPVRQRMQMVFQDPYASLNPKHTVEQIVGAPLKIHGLGSSDADRRQQVHDILEIVGIRPEMAQRYAHEFSGGQRQRVGIARALICKPDLLIADEPVSALDVSIQAQVVNLLLELKQALGLTVLFIAHDLSVVGHISDRVAVMYLGRIVEIAPTRQLFMHPQHPYTEALLSSVPVPDPTIKRRARIMLEGDIPSPINPPSGCTFRSRCRYAIDRCAEHAPILEEQAPGHFKACIRDDLNLRAAF